MSLMASFIKPSPEELWGVSGRSLSIQLSAEEFNWRPGDSAEVGSETTLD